MSVKQKVLVSRPSSQCHQLAEGVLALGAEPLVMPSIDIIKFTIPPENMAGAIAIVTSVNAANSAIENGFIFDDVKLLAVGAATTRSFTHKGYNVRWTAEPANFRRCD